VPVDEFYYEDPQNGLFYGVMLKNRGERLAPNLTATYQVRGTRSSMPSSRKRPLSSRSRV